MTRTAVLVVHGIGKPAPGETVDALVGALSVRSGGLRGTIRDDRVALPDYGVRDSTVRRWFPCHLRRARRGDDEFVFAEVWWGKRALGGDGLIGMLRLLFSALHLLVGLRVVLRTNLTANAPLRYRALQSLAWLSSFGLVGLVYALNLLLLVGLGALVVAQTAEHLFSVKIGRLTLLAGAVGAVALGIVQLQRIWTRVKVKDSQGRWAGLRALRASPFRQELWLSLVLLGSLLMWRIVSTDRSLWEYGGDMVAALTLCFTVAVAPLGLTCLLFLLAFCWRMDEWHARAQAIAATVALQTGIWAALIPTLWYGLNASLPKTWLGTAEGVPDALMQEALVAQGVHWVIGSLALVVLAMHIGWRSWRRPDLRLIVPRIPTIAMLAATTVAAAVFVAIALAEPSSLDTPWLGWIVDLTLWAEQKGLHGYTSVVLGLIVFLLPQIRVMVSLLDDVLTYLEKYTARTGLRPERPIRSRFRRVVDALMQLEREEGNFDRWVVVAHSQGTVVCLDELAASERTRQTIYRKTSRKRIRIYDELASRAELILVTAGSPFTHLYQHYFPADYPPLDDEYWEDLRARLSSWINVHRTDDFVGTTIEFWEGAGSSYGNEDIGRGGHLDYWSDERFLKHFERALQV